MSFQLYCPKCNVVCGKNPDFGVENSTTKAFEYVCGAGCKGFYMPDNLTRRHVRFPDKDEMTQVHFLPRDAEATFVQTAPNLYISTIMPEKVRKARVVVEGMEANFKFIQRRMLLHWNMMESGSATAIKALAVRNEGGKLMLKPYCLSNTEPKEGAICWGRGQSSPQSLRQAVHYYFDQPFNIDHFQDLAGSRGGFWGLRFPLPEVPAAAKRARDDVVICSLCCMPRGGECPCLGKKAQAGNPKLVSVVYRFRNYDPYSAKNKGMFDPGQWKDGTRLVVGRAFAQHDRPADSVFISVDPEFVAQAPEKVVRRKGDGTKVLVAFGKDQKPKGSIYGVDGFLFFWNGKEMFPMRRKRLRSRLVAAGIPSPVLP